MQITLTHCHAKSAEAKTFNCVWCWKSFLGDGDRLIQDLAQRCRETRIYSIKLKLAQLLWAALNPPPICFTLAKVIVGSRQCCITVFVMRCLLRAPGGLWVYIFTLQVLQWGFLTIVLRTLWQTCFIWNVCSLLDGEKTPILLQKEAIKLT